MHTQTGRMIVVTAVSAALIAAVAPAAEARHRRSLYCSETGDIVPKLTSCSARKPFKRYVICAKGLNAASRPSESRSRTMAPSPRQKPLLRHTVPNAQIRSCD